MAPDIPPTAIDTTGTLPRLADRYRLISKLGEGGMGVVHLAHDEKLDRMVAVKLLPAGSVNDADAVGRFQREARALAKLSHAGIVQAYDSGQDGDQHFLVMEYVKGRSLVAVLRDQGRLSPTRAADVAHQTALALAHAHRHGLVHRDVKPNNVLLTEEGQIKVLDLGLARFLQDQIKDIGLTREGTGMGTPDYAAPEQFRDARSADARSDIYALGCMLYHLIGGRVPFPGSSWSEKVDAHENKEPTPLEELCPEVPGGLALAVNRMMAKRPADRFQNMTDVAEALAPYVAGASRSFRDFRESAMWDGSRLAPGRGGVKPPRSADARSRAGWWAAAAVTLTVLATGWAGSRLDWFGTSPALIPSDAEARHNPAPLAAEAAKAVAEDTNVLLVSKKPEEGGKYRTINDALRDVKPGQTIRVLDNTEYKEQVYLSEASRFANITLEAPRSAVIIAPGQDPDVAIRNVPGVTIRGFRFRGPVTDRSHVAVDGACPGVNLDQLTIESGYGIVLWGITGNESEPPVVVQNCHIASAGNQGIQIDGLQPGRITPKPCGRIIVRNNEVQGANHGIVLDGVVQRVDIVGNVVSGCSNGIAIIQLLPEANDIRIANNTLLDNTHALAVFHVADKKVPGRNVQVCNNLILDTKGSDFIYYDAEVPGQVNGAGDGSVLSKQWSFHTNCRDGNANSSQDGLEKAWIPFSKSDLAQEKIGTVSRDPKSPSFLRPAADSPLATQGGGNEDPSLPRYIGALPPVGVAGWDWERAWKMPKAAQLLTVSKDAKDGGQYRSIGEALTNAKPWATIRVLDSNSYPGKIVLNRADAYQGITLEALRGATLENEGPRARVFDIVGVSDVTIRGFRFRGVSDAPETGLITAFGPCPALRLERLEFHGESTQSTNAINIINALSRVEQAIVIDACIFRRMSNGVGLKGAGRQVSRVAIRNCSFVDCGNGVWCEGDVQHLQVVGNTFQGSEHAGIHLHLLASGSQDLLFANNTCHDCGMAFNIAHGRVEGVDVRLCNNLLLGSRFTDIQAFGDGEGKTPGEGNLVAQAYEFDHNWREGASPKGEWLKGWIPPSSSDVRLDKIGGIERDSRSPAFLHPTADSPLATQGAGNVDASLPRYVGALPPPGVEGWDWERTWRMRNSNAPAAK